jgi:ABC-type amino acid transport substrate-binding protein
VGFEPTRPYGQCILSASSLPSSSIPALSRARPAPRVYRRGWRWLGAIALAFTLAGAGCAAKPETTGPPGRALSTAKPGALVVGSSFDYKPFETIFDLLSAGKFDDVATAATIQPDRERIVSFSDPYFDSRQSLTVTPSMRSAVPRSDQLQPGDVIGVQTGTIGKDWADGNLAPRGIIKTFAEITYAFAELEAGKITGIVNDEPSSQAEVRGRPGLKVVEPIDTGEHYGIAVGRTHRDFLAVINDSLKAIIDEGTYKRIFRKYFPGVPVPPEFGGPG